MARKVETFTVTAEGRDKGKQFLITEMSAFQAEKWAIRVMLALISSGMEIPDDTVRSGMQGFASITMQALKHLPRFADAEPLLDEMLMCIQVIPDPARPLVVRRLLETDIEEVATILQLRVEVIKIHTDFFQQSDPST